MRSDIINEKLMFKGSVNQNMRVSFKSRNIRLDISPV